MTDMHLNMDELLAVRDGDRSNPAHAQAHRHLAGCPTCQAELDRLHQRTARLRALATMAPVTDQYPAVRARLHWEQSQKRQRRLAGIGVAVAATLVLAVAGNHLVSPPALDAAQQLETAMTRSQLLEQRLREWSSESRVVDGQTALVVIQLEDRIAALDLELSRSTARDESERLEREVALWQQRVGLMNALVEVHVTRASNVDL